MRHTLTITRATPWAEFNDYEGEVEGELDGHHVTGHVILTLEPWDGLKPGDVREVWARFVRYRAVTIVDRSAPAELTMKTLVGTVTARDGDELKVDSVVPMDVELEPSPKHPLPDIEPGDRIRVEGQLEIDFDPDDYEDEESS